MRSPEVGEASPDALSENVELGVVDRLHRRLELALVSFECPQLHVHDVDDVLDVIGLVGFPEHECVGPMMGDAVFFVEVRVTGRNDSFDRQEPGMTMIRVESVPLPRIVSEHDAGPEFSDDSSNSAALLESAVEFTVDVLEKANFASVGATESRRRFALFLLAPECERNYVGVGVPRALRSVRAHEVMDGASVGRPFRQERSAPELDVVWMSADCKS